jgi:hypothetical protein
MATNLKVLFGIDNIEDIINGKTAATERARPLAPKVKRIQMTPDECRALCDGIKLEYLDGYEGRVLQYVITDETVDRYGDIVRASGGDFSNYRKNPVVLAFHNGKALPVGNALKTWHDEESGNVKQWVLFLDDRVDRTGMSETAFRFAASGAMKTGSIGFIPRDGKVRRPPEDERKRLRMPAHGVIYEEWELLEFSVTPVPANPNASQKSIDDIIKRGMYSADVIEQARGVFSDDEINAALEIVKSVPPTIPPSGPTESTEKTACQTVTHEVSLNKDVVELLTTVCTKFNLLIDTLSRAVTALEKNIVTPHKEASPAGAGDNVGSDDMYSEEQLAALIEESTQRIK